MGDSNVIMKVINYIEDNLAGKLCLDDVADKVGYSKFHLNRLFSESMGVTLYKYIQTRRLTVAAEKLVNTKKPIIEIAFESNYDSQQSLLSSGIKTFKCKEQSIQKISATLFSSTK